MLNGAILLIFKVIGSMLLLYIPYRIYCKAGELSKRRYKRKVWKTVGTNGVTKLMAAAFSADPKILKQAIATGGDINQQDTEGNTALMYACASTDSPLIVKMLLDTGANPSSINIKGDSAAEIAEEQKNSHIARLMRGEKIEWAPRSHLEWNLVDAVVLFILGLWALYTTHHGGRGLGGYVFSIMLLVGGGYQLKTLNYNRDHDLEEFEFYGVKPDCFKDPVQD